MSQPQAGRELTFEKLAELVKGLRPMPVFYVAHWLTGSLYFSCERAGREEWRMSPQGWSEMRKVIPTREGTAEDLYSPGVEVRHEEHPPTDLAAHFYTDPNLRKHLRWPGIGLAP